MKTHSVIISGLEQINDEVCVQIKTLPFQQPIPGQFFQAFNAESDGLLPGLLYPCRISQHELILCGEVSKSWAPGTELHLRGPRGNGFHLPPLIRKAAFTTLDQFSLNRLMALADSALNNNIEVTFFSNQHVSGLAPEIEVLPLEELSQVRDWADYLAAVLPASVVNTFRNSVQLNTVQAKLITAEIMLAAPMVCDETSSCGVCAVYTNHRWRLACKDGPVFALDDLLTEDGTIG
jgi:hypothetical protein